MPTTNSFMPAYQHAKTLSSGLGLSDELQLLLQNATRLSEEALSEKTFHFLQKVSQSLVQLNSPLGWQKLEALLKAMVEERDSVDRVAVLDRILKADNQERLRMLNDQTVAQFFASALRDLVINPQLTRQEHAERVVDKTSHSLLEDYSSMASQANYDTTKRLGKMFVTILFQIVKLFVAAESRATVEAEDKQQAEEEQKKKDVRFYPQPMKA